MDIKKITVDSSKQLKMGVLLSYISIGVNILTGLIYTPWVISTIGQDNFGLYTLAMSVISIFVFDFGLSSAVTRFLSKFIAEGKLEKTSQFLGLVSRLYITIDIILFIVLIVVSFFIPNIYQELTFEEVEKFKVIYAISALYSVISFPFIPLNGILVAYEKFIEIRICEIVHKFIIVISMSICLLLGFGLKALVFTNVLAGCIMIGMKVFILYSKIKQRIDFKYFNKLELSRIFSYSGWVTIISLAQRCMFNFAPTILGAFSGSTSIAIMGIATTLEGYTFTFASALNGMFLPKVSRIVAKNDGNVLPLMVRVGRFQIYIIGFIVIGVILLGRDFIHLWVGKTFDESYLCAVFIILPSLFHLPQDIGIQTIYVKNKVKKLSIVYVFMAIFNLICASILAPKFGAVGVCASIGLAYLFRTIGMDIIFKHDLDIDICLFFKKTYISLLLPLTLIIVISILLNMFLQRDNIYIYSVKVFLYMLVYGIIMMMSMKREEREFVLSTIFAVFKR